MGKNHIGWRLLRPWRSRKIKAINKHLHLSYRWFAEISKLDTKCRCGKEFHFVHETTTRNSYYRLRSHPCPHILRRYPGVIETLTLLENLKYSAGAIDALLGNPVPPKHSPGTVDALLATPGPPKPFLSCRASSGTRKELIKAFETYFDEAGQAYNITFCQPDSPDPGW